MTDTITIRVTEIADEPVLDSQRMALTFGVTVEDVCALPLVDGSSRIPREWINRGLKVIYQ